MQLGTDQAARRLRRSSRYRGYCRYGRCGRSGPAVVAQQPLQIRAQGRKLGAQLPDLALVREPGLLVKSALDSQCVFPPGIHLTLQFTLVDHPQPIGVLGARADLTPGPRRGEGSEQRRPQRREQAQPQQAGILDSQSKDGRSHHSHDGSAQHQCPTAPRQHRMLVGPGHGVHRTGSHPSGRSPSMTGNHGHSLPPRTLIILPGNGTDQVKPVRVHRWCTPDSARETAWAGARLRQGLASVPCFESGRIQSPLHPPRILGARRINSWYRPSRWPDRPSRGSPTLWLRLRTPLTAGAGRTSWRRAGFRGAG